MNVQENHATYIQPASLEIQATVNNQEAPDHLQTVGQEVKKLAF